MQEINGVMRNAGVAMLQPPGALGNPAVVGLAGFGTTTLLLQFHNIGWMGNIAPIVWLGFIFGGLAQFIAGTFFHWGSPFLFLLPQREKKLPITVNDCVGLLFFRHYAHFFSQCKIFLAFANSCATFQNCSVEQKWYWSAVESRKICSAQKILWVPKIFWRLALRTCAQHSGGECAKNNSLL